MKTSIADQSENLIIKHVPNSQSQLDSYMKISELNKSLIKSGLSKPRGYNLLTTEEIYRQGLIANFSQTL